MNDILLEHALLLNQLAPERLTVIVGVLELLMQSHVELIFLPRELSNSSVVSLVDFLPLLEHVVVVDEHLLILMLQLLPCTQAVSQLPIHILKFILQFLHLTLQYVVLLEFLLH
jgi:hypothetical protein